ncbi:MAG: hypothetical protein PHQ36_01535 [Anaerolineales bacterium]|nr:hypothetical protein [Anaerolineales bacterium]
MKIKIFLLALTATIILVANFQPALAGSWMYHYSAVYVQATSYGGGGKKISKISNTQWLAEISTITTPGLATVPVGWTYWTSRELCNGSIKSQKIHSGRSVRTSTGTTYNYQYMTTQSCSIGTRTAQVLGKHEVLGSKYIYRDNWIRSANISDVKTSAEDLPDEDIP